MIYRVCLANRLIASVRKISALDDAEATRDAIDLLERALANSPARVPAQAASES